MTRRRGKQSEHIPRCITFDFESRSCPACCLATFRSPLSPKESRDGSRGGTETQRQSATVTVRQPPQRELRLRFSSPPSDDLSLFQNGRTAYALSPCPCDRGWSPAAAPRRTTAGSPCSAGRSPSRPPRTALSR